MIVATHKKPQLTQAMCTPVGVSHMTRTGSEDEPQPIFGFFVLFTSIGHCGAPCAEATDKEGGFYSFAIVTRDPPPEVAAAGHDRCVIPIRAENIDAWLNPNPQRLSDMLAILDDPADAYFQHELVT
jgi:hypothetical protein